MQHYKFRMARHSDKLFGTVAGALVAVADLTLAAAAFGQMEWWNGFFLAFMGLSVAFNAGAVQPVTLVGVVEQSDPK